MAEEIEITKRIMCPEMGKPAEIKLIYEKVEGGEYKLKKMACKLEMEMSFRGSQCNHSCEERLKKEA